MRSHSDIDHFGCLGISGVILIIGGFIFAAWWSDRNNWHPQTGDTVVFHGTPVIYLGSAGRDTTTYLVRFPDGSEKHALFKELSPVKEKQ